MERQARNTAGIITNATASRAPVAATTTAPVAARTVNQILNGMFDSEATKNA